jgi:hypothetical protein
MCKIFGAKTYKSDVDEDRCSLTAFLLFANHRTKGTPTNYSKPLTYVGNAQSA